MRNLLSVINHFRTVSRIPATLARSLSYWLRAVRAKVSPPVCTKLLILDDAFPNTLSSFRIAEFNYYLSHFPDCVVFSTQAVPWPGKSHRWTVARYREQFPELAQRWRRWHPDIRVTAELAYCIFVNNAFTFIDYIEENRIPFVFTLYPGGGFQLYDSVSDQKLRRICRSPCFRHVISTQSVTTNYLIDRGFVTTDQVTFIYGGVLPKPLADGGESKDPQLNSINICFVANRYMPGGFDKGFDLFIDVARRLVRQHSNVEFHVVGEWSHQDHDTSDLAERIHYYGTQPTEFFATFYLKMDAILSPNRANKLAPGAFDGFPTGCCVDAGMAGVAVFCTDPLQLNGPFIEREEIVIIPADGEEISQILAAYLLSLSTLDELRKRGQAKFCQVFDLESQMQARYALLHRETE